VVLAAYLLRTFMVGPMLAGPWLVLALGIAYGVVLAVVGTQLAGTVLDRRGPEVLSAITPRR
jgi:ABC-2 type transport system permease protein